MKEAMDVWDAFVGPDVPKMMPDVFTEILLEFSVVWCPHSIEGQGTLNAFLRLTRLRIARNFPYWWGGGL